MANVSDQFTNLNGTTFSFGGSGGAAGSDKNTQNTAWVSWVSLIAALLTMVGCSFLVFRRAPFLTISDESDSSSRTFNEENTTSDASMPQSSPPSTPPMATIGEEANGNDTLPTTPVAPENSDNDNNGNNSEIVANNTGRVDEEPLHDIFDEILTV